MPIYNCSKTAVWLSLLLRWWWYKINYNDELFGGMATWEKSRKSYSQKQLPDVFYKKGVLKNFAKFIGKHLCQSLFFNRTPPVAASVHCCLWISHSVFCSVSHRRSFYCHYRHEQSHCVHLKVIQVGGFLLHLSLLKYFLSRANWSLTELIFPS